MSKKHLRFQRINIQRSPGFEDGLPVIDNLNDEINIIHGPNASGKTTLVRALCAALWPETGDRQFELTANFELEDALWRVALEGQHRSCTRDGQQTSDPGFPPAGQSDRYQLSLHDLLQHETRDESFAESIIRESAGGYDVRAAEEDLEYRDRCSSSTISEAREAEKITDQLRSKRRQMEELRGKENQLPRLRRKLEEAQKAEQRVRLLDLALQYVDARDAYRKQKTKLDGYPQVMHSMTGEEHGNLQDISDDIENWRQKKSRAERQAEQAQNQLDAAELPEDVSHEGLIAELEERRDKLSEIENKIEQLDGDIDGSCEQRNEIRNRIDESINEDKLSQLGTADWGRLAEFAEKAERIRADKQAWESLRHILRPDDESNEDADALRAEQQALENWLNGFSAQSEPDGIIPHLPLTAVVAVGVGAIILSLFLSGGIFAIVLLVLTSAAALVVHHYGSESETGGDVQQAQETIVEQRGLDGPTSWSPEEVGQRLTTICRQLGQHEIKRVREERWESRREQLDDLQERSAQLEKERERLREELGAAPDLPDVQLTALLDHVRRWQRINDKMCELEARRQDLREKHAEMRSVLETKLTPYGYEEPADAASATGQIQDLKGRLRKYRKAKQERKAAGQTRRTAAEELERLTARRNKILEKLDADDLDEVQQLCEGYQAFQKCEKDCNSAEAVKNRVEEELEQHPEYTPELKNTPRADLRDEKESLETIAAEKQEIQSKITEIETEIGQARQQHDLENLAAEKELALDRLHDRLREDYARVVGHVLSTHVREQTSAANRPDVFQRARTLLTAITNRYELRMEEGTQPVFQVYDGVKERFFGLNQLSSATRVQVLMAVRMAFVETQESGIRLPMFMDETLANTDHRRAEAIIEAALEFAREGRQIFYLTAQGDEVARWRSVLNRFGDLGHTVHSLTEVGENRIQSDVPDLDAFAIEEPDVPAPTDESHQEYGQRLEVPPFDPRQGAGSAHAWYVADDVDLLHHLLEIGAQHWGEIRNILRTGNARVISSDEAAIERIRENGALLESFVKAWSIGRGKPIDREALEESGAVSDTFIDDVTELAREVDGDASQLIERLQDGQVARFRTDKIEELAAYCEENGYIDPAPTRDRAEIRMRMTAMLVDMGCPQEEAGRRAGRLLNRIAAGPQSA